MLQRRLLLVITAFLFLVNAKHRAITHPVGWPLTAAPADTFSFAQPTEVTTRHIALDLTVDFEARTLSGKATLEIENLKGTSTLVLDTEALQISKVTLDDGEPATWQLGTGNSFGRPLNITIEPDTESVTIEYVTSPGADGLTWATAQQSYGRKFPYLYSLNEPVDARSWIPCQDTPSVRSTYEAVIHAPQGLIALMSAANNPTAINDTGVYRFQMPYTIPAYLIALAVGKIEFRAFDERTGVYAEPELIDDAEWELQYLPEMVDIAEDLAGPFPFLRHDVLFLPPTFQVGGMEHPMLNFVTPFNTIDGNHNEPDADLVIAHELAHSWAGDATTLANWNDVWLNEGITSYLTLRILEQMWGPERTEYAWFIDRRGYENFAKSVDPEETILHRTVTHPFDGFNSTGYTKGELFMKMLEDTIGRERFDVFLRRYFQIFAWRWIDDVNFRAALDELVLSKDQTLEPKLHLDEWLYEPGLPSNTTAPTTAALFTAMQPRIAAFSNGTPITQLQPETWKPVQVDIFLQNASSSQLHARMAEIDAALHLSSRNMPPYTWLVHAIRANYQPAFPAVERALLRGGPAGWIINLYSVMAETTAGRDRARTIFASARERYDVAIASLVESILGLNAATQMKAA